MKTYLITGSGGLIGSNLIQALSGSKLFAISRQDHLESQNKNLMNLPIDFNREWDIKKLPSNVDAVIHLAQSSDFRDFPDKALDILNVNVLSAIKLLDYAIKIGAKTFILASSGGIYGSKDQSFKEESDIVASNDLGYYLGTKLCTEILAENYSKDLNLIILRFFFVYGPGQKDSMLIPRLVSFINDGIPIKLQGQDGIKINPTYVEDAVNAILMALKLEESQKINIAGPEILSMREIGETIGNILKKKPAFEISKETQPNHLIGDISKMKNILGVPNYNFKDGIERYLNYLNTQSH